MASKAFVVKNDPAGYTFRIGLFAQSDNQPISNPVLAAGDFTISLDGGTFANLATLPDVDPDSTYQVKVVLSQAEINANEVFIVYKDVSGAQWHGGFIVIPTVAVGYDGLATAAALQTVDDNVDAILADTGTTLDTLIKDIPTVSEFEARTIVAANYFDPAADTVANVTTVGSVTTKTGYELAAGYDAAKTAASQTSVDDLPTNAELAAALGTADDAVLLAIAALNNLGSVGAQAAAEAALTAYDAATGTDVNAATSGLATASALSTVAGNVSSILADTGTDGVVISTAQMEAISDIIASRSASHVQNTAEADSPAAMALAMFHSSMSGGTWTIYKTDNATAFDVVPITTDANADPVTGAANT